MRPLVFLLCLSACRPTPAKPVVLEPVVATPPLVMLEGWVGFDTTTRVELLNPNQVAVETSVDSSTTELVVAPTVTLAPGESTALPVTYRPSAAGRALAELRFTGGALVTFELFARTPPACPPVDECHPSTFDPTSGACVHQTASNGTACSSPFACFASATCLNGQCVGSATTCDDHDRCTTDVCGTLGCGALDATGACPFSTNPCEAPVCDADAGCGLANLDDGTPCGPRTCDEARVCIEGACVTRRAPRTQGCLEVWLGHPGGRGLNDGIGEAARFQGITSMWWQRGGQRLYVTDGDLVRSITPSGKVETIAGGAPGSRLGFGRTAGFSSPRIVGEAPNGNLVVWDVGDRTHAEALRFVSPLGLVTGFVGGGSFTGCAAGGSGIGATACPGVWEDGGFEDRWSEVLYPRWVADPAHPGGWVRIQHGRLRTTPPQLQRISALGELTSTSLPDGTLCDVRCLEPAFVVCTNGLVLGVPPANCDRPAFEPITPFRRRLLDGGTEVVADRGEADDGPLGTAGLGLFIHVAAAEDQGRLAVFDEARNHVRVIDSNTIRTLAGPRPTEGLVDGPRAQALVGGTVASMTWSDGRLWFVDRNSLLDGGYVELLRSAESVVVTHGLAPGWNDNVVFPSASPETLVLTTRTSSPNILRWLRDGGTEWTNVDGLFAADGPGGMVGVIANYVEDTRDGGVSGSLPRRVCAGGVVDGGILLLEGPPSGRAVRVSALERDGGSWVLREVLELVDAGAEVPCRQSAIAFSPTGDLYSAWGRNLRVVRLATGTSTDLATLFDWGYSVAIDDQERVYIGTTGGVLRLAP